MSVKTSLSGSDKTYYFHESYKFTAECLLSISKQN